MEKKFYPGFTVYRNGDNPVYVCPHSGPSLLGPNNRDDYSDTVASFCFEKTGGCFILSNIPRTRALGIDFNRDLPPEELAIKRFPDFMAKKTTPELQRFSDDFAFAAKDRQEYYEKKRIYENFWNVTRNLGSIIIFIHRKVTRIKNYPSVIDIITYKGRGVDKNTIIEIVNNVNKKNEEFLKSIKQYYSKMVMLETNRMLERFRKIHDTTDFRQLDVYEKRYISQDFEVIKKLGDFDHTIKAIHEFNHKNFVYAAQNMLQKPILPKITIENIFKGNKALSQKDRLFNKSFLVMEVEINEFMGGWYPQATADILIDILSMLRSAKLYQHLGISQTHVPEFFCSKKDIEERKEKEGIEEKAELEE